MTGLAFDTLAYARRMEQAGFTRVQAEALAEEQAKLIDERLATKADLAALEARQEIRFKELEARLVESEARQETRFKELELRTTAALDTRLAETKAELIKWMFGAVTGAVLVNILAMLGVMYGLAKLRGH